MGTRTITTPSHRTAQAVLRVDGGGVFTPGISQFGTGTRPVGTPAIDSSLTSDVYLTINSIPDRGGIWTFGVVVQPMVMWLWIGGALIIVGSVLSAVPGRRRRPTDPVSAPVAWSAPGAAPARDGDGPHTPDLAEAPPRREPVRAGEGP